MFEYTTESGLNPPIHNLQQFLVWKFNKHAEEPDFSWSGEIKLACRLTKTYPSVEFWKTYSLGYKLNSLAFFLTQKGKNILFQDYNSYMLANPPKIEYSLGEKVGEDRKFEKKKSLREFLA